MTTPPVQLRQAWPLALSLAAHLLLVSAVGFRSAPLRESEANPQVTQSRLIVSIIQPGSSNQPETTTMRTEGTTHARPIKTRATLPTQVTAASEGALLREPISEAIDAVPALIEISSPLNSYYFKTNQLDAKPQIQFDLPAELALALTGSANQSAIFRLLINESGDIDDVEIIESSFSVSHQNLIREALGKMKFDAGRIGDKSVKSEMKIELMVEKIAPRRNSKSD
jgi:hypothetical protein